MRSTAFWDPLKLNAPREVPLRHPRTFCPVMRAGLPSFLQREVMGWMWGAFLSNKEKRDGDILGAPTVPPVPLGRRPARLPFQRPGHGLARSGVSWGHPDQGPAGS